jgi:hypothetical protein
MPRALETPLPPAHRPVPGLRGLVFGAALGVLVGAAGPSTARADAVAAPNLRLGVAYDYAHVDDTSTAFFGPSTTATLELDDVDGHAVSGQLVGTVPLIAFTGLRTSVRGGWMEARRSLDALDPGSSEIDAYGALAEVFARDPGFGSFAVGGGFDRLEGESGVAANQLTGSVDLQVFFPDLGAGPLDWFTRFEFRHRQIEGDGQPFDVDADVYHVTGGARWFAGPDVAFVLAGTWQRVEEEFFSEDDQTGSLALHWRLPTALGPASIEVFAGGSAGVSEYKQSPLRGDHRLVYGARAGLTLRLLSGRTLVESMRQYD